MRTAMNIAANVYSVEQDRAVGLRSAIVDAWGKWTASKSSWRDPHGLAEFARRLGQNEPRAWRWEARANVNYPPVKPATRVNLFVGLALGRPSRLT